MESFVVVSMQTQRNLPKIQWNRYKLYFIFGLSLCFSFIAGVFHSIPFLLDQTLLLNVRHFGKAASAQVFIVIFKYAKVELSGITNGRTLNFLTRRVIYPAMISMFHGLLNRKPTLCSRSFQGNYEEESLPFYA